MDTMNQRIENEYLEEKLEDDDEMMLIKKAIESLTPVQRKIWLAYVDNGTYSSTAKQFKVSTPTVRNYIQDIRKKITDYVNTNI